MMMKLIFFIGENGQSVSIFASFVKNTGNLNLRCGPIRL